MQATRTTLGGLRCVASQATAGPPSLLVVLCHGFGAPGEDLVPLAQELCRQRPELERARFLFPAAPLSLGWTGTGEGLAWWMIDVERLMAGGTSELRAEVPKGLPKARRMLRELVDVATRQAGLPLSRTVLGGFSQGAMLATDVALRLEEAPAGLCILSGIPIAEAEWRRLAPARRGLGVLQTHGRQDPLLPFSLAEALRDLLAGAGMEVDFRAFDDGHTIPPEALGALGDFLAQRLPEAP
jgi:phospholipase/carboxylesterase